MAEMRELARFRRVLWMLYDGNDNAPTPCTQNSLAEKLSLSVRWVRGSSANVILGVDKRVAAQLTRRLKEEGYLTRGRIPQPVKTAAQVATRQRVYGDPFTSVRNKVGQLEVRPYSLTYADILSMKYPRTLQLQRFKWKKSSLGVNV